MVTTLKVNSSDFGIFQDDEDLYLSRLSLQSTGFDQQSLTREISEDNQLSGDEDWEDEDWDEDEEEGWRGKLVEGLDDSEEEGEEESEEEILEEGEEGEESPEGDFFRDVDSDGECIDEDDSVRIKRELADIEFKKEYEEVKLEVQHSNVKLEDSNIKLEEDEMVDQLGEALRFTNWVLTGDE